MRSGSSADRPWPGPAATPPDGLRRRLRPNENAAISNKRLRRGNRMTAQKPDRHTLGWIGTGRMGSVLASRLLEHGCDLMVYNRTRAKAEPLATRGARIVDRPADLSDRDVGIQCV